MSQTEPGKETRNVSEEEARQVAEDSRQKEWKSPSIMKEIFLGNFNFELISPYPAMPEREQFRTYYGKLKTFLLEKVDPAKIDQEEEYPTEVIDGLRALGAFGMKIPTKYGGIGLTQAEYDQCIEMITAHDANLCALVSAHQSIGVPQPIKTFGTKEQKERFLPRCAKGAISAFALTEHDVGSDPARLTTTITKTEDGKHYIVNGEKLWCTNGTIAELFVVMGRNPETRKISAIVVDAADEGVKIEHRCRFMGLKALANGVISFNNVKVPVENLIGKEGMGLKIALVTLNTGRLALPAGCLGSAKKALEICRTWAAERVQWGHPIGKHEAITHKLAHMAIDTFAMESMSNLCSRLSDRGGYDIRLEAAAAKLWLSEKCWNIMDDMMQIKGGRGYETEASLEARGEKPIGVERMMRDNRINRIFEGSSEIMHLFMAREAVDTHLSVAEILINPKASFGAKAAALPKIGWFYAKWYPKLWFGWTRWPKYSEYGKLSPFLGFCDRASKKLAREIFHGMSVYQAKMQIKQGFLFRAVDIGTEIFAMAATCARVHAMQTANDPNKAEGERLGIAFCKQARRRIKGLFHTLWHNDDNELRAVGLEVLKGDHAWFEDGILKLSDTFGTGEEATEVELEEEAKTPPAETKAKTSEEPKREEVGAAG